MLIDLQLHSHHSDGYLSPKHLAKILANYKIKIASLTDHNSIAGQTEFKLACQNYGIKTINGLELYVKEKNYTFNILWYNYDLNSPELLALLKNTWKRRHTKISKMLIPLYRKGFKIDFDSFLKNHQNYLPINKLADYIWSIPVNRKIIKNNLKIKNPRQEDIVSYCFYPKTGPRLKEARISFSRIVALRKKIGGQIIFAHPALHKKISQDWYAELAKKGLDGLELLSPHHSYNSLVKLSAIARDLNLITTGGSDFHLWADVGTKPRYSWDYFVIQSRQLRKIEKIINKNT